MLAFCCVFGPAGVQPRQIGIIITNSSLFNTTPSLSATIMNHFKMSSKTLNYNLAGMGCSAGEACVVKGYAVVCLVKQSWAGVQFQLHGCMWWRRPCCA
jgi:predicted naringenin-chalcone synthase